MRDEALLSIGGLARATGVPVNTLRTWERRHGFPTPTRLPSGHRRYDSTQVDHILGVQRAMELGYKPSQLESISLAELLELASKGSASGRSSAGLVSETVLAWLSHVTRLDMAALEKDLLTAWSRYGAIGLLDDLLKPFLIELGRRWHAGHVSVSQEHAATECVAAFLAARWRRLMAGSNGPSVVLATLPKEEHVLGLHQVAVVLSMHGYRVHFLGRGAPLPALVEAVEQLRPMALMLGISLAAAPKQTVKHLRSLRSEISDRVQMVIGGAGAPTFVQGVLTLGSMAAVQEWASQAVNSAIPDWVPPSASDPQTIDEFNL